jgi:hypothetical protein
MSSHNIQGVQNLETTFNSGAIKVHDNGKTVKMDISKGLLLRSLRLVFSK